MYNCHKQKIQKLKLQIIMSRPPLKVNMTFYQLTQQAQIPQEIINFNNVGLTSERQITICDGKTDGTGQLVTIDLQSGDINKRNNKADQVLPHPTKNFTAVRAKHPELPGQTIIHVYNMDVKEKVCSSTIPELVKYWQWTSEQKLGIVGTRGIFSISIENAQGGQSPAERIAEREGALQGSQTPIQITNHQICPNKKFSFITGLSKKTEADGSFGVGGSIQLTSLQLGKSQFLDGYTACFGKMRLYDDQNESVLFAYTEKNKLQGKVTISEIGQPADPSKKFKAQIDISYPDQHEQDFPIYMQIDPQLGFLYLLTKHGLLFLFEVSEASLILRSRISTLHLLSGCPYYKTNGCLILSKNGNIIQLEVDEQPIVDFIKQAAHIKNYQMIAKKIALRAGLPGSEQYYLEQFQQLFSTANYDDAAKLVARSPGTILRNKDTIERFKQLPKADNTPHPILKLFFIILESVKLNEIETKEICQLVLSQNKHQMIAKWVDESKLFLTEELGDTLRQIDPKTAEKIYTSINSPKAVAMRIQRGDIEGALSTARPEDLIAQLKTLSLQDPQSALNFAKASVKSGRLAATSAAEALFNSGLQNELAIFCLECLGDTPENANWQTMVLEMTLKMNPSLAETIFQSGKWSNYSKLRVAPLCEQKGLYARALENYTDPKDIKRVLINNANLMPPEFIKSYFQQTVPAEYAPQLLQELIGFTRNIKLAIEIAQSCFTRIGVKELVESFEGAGSFEGVFYFLLPLLEKTRDQKIYHKFIEACVKCAQVQELERIIQNYPDAYDPQHVLNLLLQTKLSDPKCLIILCDKNGYIKEMTRYLWENNYQTYIEMYVIRVNRENASEVLGSLMDMGAEENYLKQLLNTIGGNCNVISVVSEFEQRNRLRLVEHWLEQRVAEGNTFPDIHNSLAKLSIDFDKNPEQFLKEDKYYDVFLIGKYAEHRDPLLAFIAYSRDQGKCDQEIIDLTNKNALFRLQAQYLVKRADKQLWKQALDEENTNRSLLVDQVISTALPESKSPEEVSAAVQAFLLANMPHELHGLLEKIVLHSSEFSGYQKLQNLLITTAMRIDPSRVMDYLNRLDKYDGEEIVKQALSDDFKLYEEAFLILKKLNQPVRAVRVLLDYIQNYDRAIEFAEKSQLKEVWSQIAETYLNQDQLVPAIDCFLRAKDPSKFEDVILLSKQNPNYDKLLSFLEMARETKREPIIDNEYIYCLSHLNKVQELESFVQGGNTADLARCGDRLFQEALYETSRILYQRIKSNSRMASCHVKLGQFNQAIDCAKKANSAKTWKEVAFACVEEREFKLAIVAATQVALVPDTLEEMVQFYELHESPDEAAIMLEQALANEKSHVGVFTELASLYAKYKQHKLLDFIKAYFGKLNVTKLSRVCRKYQLWKELTFLHSNYGEYDLSVLTMVEHSPLCFEHDQFVSDLLKASNSDLLYKAIQFYIEEEPLRLNELLKMTTSKIDFQKAVSILLRLGALPLAEEWLKSVQQLNNQAVNDALNKLYLESGDHEALRESVSQYDQIDALGLAKQIGDHQSPELRRISALIYRRNKKYQESLDLSIADMNYRDAVETVLESKNQLMAKNLLSFFAKNGIHEFFTVMSYTCYELISSSDMLELAWRYQLLDFAMPFIIQTMKDLNSKIDHLQKKHEEREKKEEEKLEKDAHKKIDVGGIMGMGGNAMLNTGIPMLMNQQPQQPFMSQQPQQPFMSQMTGNTQQTSFMGQQLPNNTSMSQQGFSTPYQNNPPNYPQGPKQDLL